jgi:hypothetical protein
LLPAVLCRIIIDQQVDEFMKLRVKLISDHIWYGATKMERRPDIFGALSLSKQLEDQRPEISQTDPPGPADPVQVPFGPGREGAVDGPLLQF